MRWILLLAAAHLAAPASANALYKCLARNGEASYQSQACADGQRTVWVRELAPLAPAAAVPVTISAPEPSVRRITPPAAARRATKSSGHAGAAATRCAAARQSAARQRDRLWNRLSFKQRSELDARVALACAR
jgi:hypothetical protein